MGKPSNPFENEDDDLGADEALGGFEPFEKFNPGLTRIGTGGVGFAGFPAALRESLRDLGMPGVKVRIVHPAEGALCLPVARLRFEFRGPNGAIPVDARWNDRPILDRFMIGDGWAEHHPTPAAPLPWSTAGNVFRVMVRDQDGYTATAERRYAPCLAPAGAPSAGPGPAPTPSTWELRIVSGDGQAGLLGRCVGDALVVQLIDEHAGGSPVAGVPIRFEPADPAGFVVEAPGMSTVTDAGGNAAVRYVLGRTTGPQAVKASVAGEGGAAEVIFHEEGLAPKLEVEQNAGMKGVMLAGAGEWGVFARASYETKSGEKRGISHTPVKLALTSGAVEAVPEVDAVLCPESGQTNDDGQFMAGVIPLKPGLWDLEISLPEFPEAGTKKYTADARSQTARALPWGITSPSIVTGNGKIAAIKHPVELTIDTSLLAKVAGRLADVAVERGGDTELTGWKLLVIPTRSENPLAGKTSCMVSRMGGLPAAGFTQVVGLGSKLTFQVHPETSSPVWVAVNVHPVIELKKPKASPPPATPPKATPPAAPATISTPSPATGGGSGPTVPMLGAGTVSAPPPPSGAAGGGGSGGGGSEGGDGAHSHGETSYPLSAHFELAMVGAPEARFVAPDSTTPLPYLPVTVADLIEDDGESSLSFHVQYRAPHSVHTIPGHLRGLDTCASRIVGRELGLECAPRPEHSNARFRVFQSARILLVQDPPEDQLHDTVVFPASPMTEYQELNDFLGLQTRLGSLILAPSDATTLSSWPMNPADPLARPVTLTAMILGLVMPVESRTEWWEWSEWGMDFAARPKSIPTGLPASPPSRHGRITNYAARRFKFAPPPGSTSRSIQGTQFENRVGSSAYHLEVSGAAVLVYPLRPGRGRVYVEYSPKNAQEPRSQAYLSFSIPQLVLFDFQDALLSALPARLGLGYEWDEETLIEKLRTRARSRIALDGTVNALFFFQSATEAVTELLERTRHPSRPSPSHFLRALGPCRFTRVRFLSKDPPATLWHRFDFTNQEQERSERIQREHAAEGILVRARSTIYGETMFSDAVPNQGTDAFGFWPEYLNLYSDATVPSATIEEEAARIHPHRNQNELVVVRVQSILPDCGTGPNGWEKAQEAVMFTALHEVGHAMGLVPLAGFRFAGLEFTRDEAVGFHHTVSAPRAGQPIEELWLMANYDFSTLQASRIASARLSEKEQKLLRQLYPVLR